MFLDFLSYQNENMEKCETYFSKLLVKCTLLADKLHKKRDDSMEKFSR